MADYEALYWDAVNRYNNACTEQSNIDNESQDLRDNQRPVQTNLINQLQTDISNRKTAVEGIILMMGHEEDLGDFSGAVETKTDDADFNYKAAVTCDTDPSKSLNSTFSDELAATRSALTTFFDTLSTKKGNLEEEIEELQTQLTSAETLLTDIDNKISSNSTRSWELCLEKSRISAEIRDYDWRRKNPDLFPVFYYQ